MRQALAVDSLQIQARTDHDSVNPTSILTCLLLLQQMGELGAVFPVSSPLQLGADRRDKQKTAVGWCMGVWSRILEKLLRS